MTGPTVEVPQAFRTLGQVRDDEAVDLRWVLAQIELGLGQLAGDIPADAEPVSIETLRTFIQRAASRVESAELLAADLWPTPAVANEGEPF